MQLALVTSRCPLESSSMEVLPVALPYVAGALYTYLAGFAVGPVMVVLRGPRTGEDWRTAELSLVERALYFVSAAVGREEVILAWLVFKVGSQWRKWTKEPGVFNTFAIGTLLNLGIGVSGGLLPQALRDGNHPLQALLVVGPLGMCGLVALQRIRSPQYKEERDRAEPQAPGTGRG